MLLGWLRGEWARRCSHLPSLDEFLADGRVLLLLDGLNELPHTNLDDYIAYVRQWRAAAHVLLRQAPGNRLVFSCRTLDYTTPLSSQELRVPRLQIRPLSDQALWQYLESYVPGDTAALRERIAAVGLTDVLRVPYYVRLFAEALDKQGTFPTSRVGVFAGFIRSSLRREIGDRHNPLFDPDFLLARRDYLRLMRARRWVLEWELPDRGKLMPAIDTLALEMHRVARQTSADGGGLTFDRAAAVISQPEAEDIMEAGMALGILNDRADRDVVAFTHLQMQAFFVARTLAAKPQVDLVARPWRAHDIVPGVPELRAVLHSTEPLPPLNQTGWEEPTMLALEMDASPDDSIGELASVNLALAGRCATRPAVLRRLGSERLATLRHMLVERSQDMAADLRDRISCGLALGELGDPRLLRTGGPEGPYLMPPLVDVAGGPYPIGEDEPIETTEGVQRGHMPRHDVILRPYAIGRFPVTNAEFRCFVEGGGYDDERWWDDTTVSRRWRRGVGVAHARRAGTVDVVEFFLAQPDVLEELHGDGTMDDFDYSVMRGYMEMSKRQLAEALKARFPDGRASAPGFWKLERANQPAQPVVGITWYEARAYCRWLSAQTGQPFRLPTEVEWEAAARGTEARRYAYGDTFDPLACNTIETHVRQQTPIGVFPNGETPRGISDMSGNVWEWTSSAWGTSPLKPTYGYPYNAHDGRENPEASLGMRRVVRGGSALTIEPTTRTAHRGVTLPGIRVLPNGMRLACDV